MKIFNQGRTGSPTYNYVNNRAKTQYSWAPSSRPNPRTDLGARSSRAIGNWWNNNFDEEESVGWRGAAIRYGPRAINAVRTWGPVIKHCVSAMCGGDEMANDEFVGRPSYTQGNGRTYRSNGYTMNSRGYLANPSRSAQIRARNAGALTNSEARSMGLRNYRDEMDNDDEEFVGRMPGFIGSTFRHSVNNQRPEVQRANRRGFINGMKATFKNPGDIPTSKSSAAQKGLELGVNMHKNGYGSKGMGNWDEMD